MGICMMGGFFIRFVRYLTAEDFAKLLQLARARTFKVVKNGSDAVVMWLLIGRHWVAGVSVGFRTAGDTHHISFCPPELLERGDKMCVEQEERELRSEWLFQSWDCHHIDVSVKQGDREGYRYEIHYTCYEVERKAVFAVEINTTQPFDHDDFILQLVAEELTSESPRTVLRPM
jgi:hypothetical protein